MTDPTLTPELYGSDHQNPQGLAVAKASMSLSPSNGAIAERLIRIKDRLTDRADRDAINDAVNRIYELAARA